MGHTTTQSAVCKQCRTELSPRHLGPCPECGNEGKLVCLAIEGSIKTEGSLDLRLVKVPHHGSFVFFNDWSLFIRVSGKIYEKLLNFYPVEHRQEYGADMAQTFHRLCRDTYYQAGVWGVCGVWGRER